MTGHCNLSRVKSLIQKDYTIIRGDNGFVVLIPRNEVAVECEVWKGAARVMLKFAEDCVVTFNAPHVEDLMAALQKDQNDNSSDPEWLASREARLVAISSCMENAFLQYRPHGESYCVELRVGSQSYSFEGARDLPFDSCAVELTPETWAEVRSKILAML